ARLRQGSLLVDSPGRRPPSGALSLVDVSTIHPCPLSTRHCTVVTEQFATSAMTAWLAWEPYRTPRSGSRMPGASFLRLGVLDVEAEYAPRCRASCADRDRNRRDLLAPVAPVDAGVRRNR